MSNASVVIRFSIAIIVMIAVVAFIYWILEKRKKQKETDQFKKFSTDHKMIEKNLRAVPRVAVPNSLEVVLTLTDSGYRGLKSRALDISLSGFSVKPDFPLRKLALNTTIKNVSVTTPINKFVIKEMKTVRIDHQIDKRLMAFHIEAIAEDQFENLKRFMAYLDEFLRKKDEE